MSNENQTEDLHAIFISESNPNFDSSQLAFAHPLEEDVTPTQFSVPVEEDETSAPKPINEGTNPEQINQSTASADPGKIKSPIKAFSSAAATALPKVDKMINGSSSRHYKTLASTTSEDDERLLQGSILVFGPVLIW